MLSPRSEVASGMYKIHRTFKSNLSMSLALLNSSPWMRPHQPKTVLPFVGLTDKHRNTNKQKTMTKETRDWVHEVQIELTWQCGETSSSMGSFFFWGAKPTTEGLACGQTRRKTKDKKGTGELWKSLMGGGGWRQPMNKKKSSLTASASEWVCAHVCVCASFPSAKCQMGH